MSQAGLIDVVGATPSIPTTFTTDSGTAVPILNTIDIAGGTGVNTAGAGNIIAVNIDSPVLVSNGGTGVSTLTGVLTGNGTGAVTGAAITQYGVLVGDASNAVTSTAVGTSGDVLTSNGAGVAPTYQTPVAGTVTSVSGTTNRISSTGGATPVIDIDSSYIGQGSITTLGTISTGVWTGTTISETNGGTNQSTYTTGDILYSDSANSLAKLAVGSNTEVLTLAAGVPTWAAPTVGTVTSVSGTTNRVSSTGGATPVIDIDSSYIGQGSITTLGTISTGVWTATDVGVAHGGTGASTLTGVITGNGTSALTGNSVTNFGVLLGGAGNTVSSTAVGVSGDVLTSNGAGSDPTYQTPTTGTVTSVSGTTNRVSSTGGATPVIDVDSAYVGQGSITTLGTISTGVWTATDVGVLHGGTGRSTGSVAYGLIAAGTTATGAQQTIASVGTANQLLQSQGAGALPQFATVTSNSLTTSLTAGSVVFSDGTNLTEDNSNLFWDDTNNRLGIGTATPLDTFHVVGAMELDHTAAENDDHALELVCDANGFTDVKAIDIDYITGALAAGQDEEAIIVNIDESASTGGIIAGYLVLTTAEGSATVNGYETGINVNPIVHESGTFGDADSILNKAVDVTAALASGGAGAISIFVADNDTITIGDAAQWGEHEIILATGASGGGIAPTFEYSTGGAAFSAFSPADGTNGFRNSGAILWDASALAGWATATSGLYEVRITRTRNSLSTTPIIDELQISALTEYKWDKDGNVNLNSLTLTTPLVETSGGTNQSTYTTGDILYSDSANSLAKLAVGSNTEVLTLAAGVPSWAAPTTGSVTSVSGTTNRVSSTGGATPVIDIDAAYVGQGSITTLGTISTGVWTGTTISETNGGTNQSTYTTGDILYSDSANSLAKLPISTAGHILNIDSGIPEWSAPQNVSTMAGMLSVPGGFLWNIGVSLSAGVLTISGYEGTSLSAGSPGIISMKDNSSQGSIKQYVITSNQTLTATDMNGNLWGTTASTAYASSKPFYLYVMVDDSEIAPIFALSDIPNRTISPPAANIADPGDPVADAQGDMFAFSTITETSYNGNNVLCVGGITMTKSSSDVWTIEALTSGDGLGQFHDARIFTFPTGQYGATSALYLKANGGTAPVFTTQESFYQIFKNGWVDAWYDLRGDGGTDGVGAVLAQLSLPMKVNSWGFSNDPFSSNRWLVTSPGTGTVPVVSRVLQGTNTAEFNTNAGGDLDNGNFSSGNRNLLGRINYPLSIGA